MNFSNLLNQIAGNAGNENQTNSSSSAGDVVRGLTSNIPGGLAGGAVAGGLVAMLVGSKSARKTAGKAAKYGGAAVLGGLALKAYQNWQSNSATNAQTTTAAAQQPPGPHTSQPEANGASYEREALAHINGLNTAKHFQLALIKAMIASARADGSIDNEEQSKISAAIEKMGLDSQEKSQLLELFLKPISVEEIVRDLESLEQKAEIYLASCLVIELDHQAEYAHLSNLSSALQLPSGLEHELRSQAMDALSETA